MISDFGFCLPTRIRFGRGITKEIGEEIRARGLKHPMLVTDKGIISTGLADKVKGYIEDAGFECMMFDGIVPNPRDYDCDKGAAYALEMGADVLIAIGGGGPMDTAKAMATVMTNGKTSREWIDVELDVEAAPVICIPTTCGTGSEVTFNAVINNTATHLKGNIFDPKCAPITAFVDPEMIDGLPGHLIASTGIDALTHALEAYVSTVATPVTDAIAIHAIKLIGENIVSAANDRNPDALDNIMLASMLAGMAFGNADTAAVHCIAECFGGFYDIPHGVTNAMFLADVSEASIPGNPSKYAQAAKTLGADTEGMTDEEAAEEGIKVIRRLCADLNIPKLTSFEMINEKDFDYLAQAASEHVCNPSNPVEFTKEQYLEIFGRVMKA
ncbi:MAG: iron-containing alcohol dehydrogenase [Anaerovoracaceae bacterium]